MLRKTVAVSILSLVEIIEPEQISDISGFCIDIKFGFHRLVKLYDFYGKSAYGENRLIENPIFENSAYFGKNSSSFEDCLFCLIHGLNKLGIDLSIIHSAPILLSEQKITEYLQDVLRYSNKSRTIYKKPGYMNIYFTKNAFQSLKRWHIDFPREPDPVLRN
jgi:hypothetical protein